MRLCSVWSMVALTATVAVVFVATVRATTAEQSSAAPDGADAARTQLAHYFDHVTAVERAAHERRAVPPGYLREYSDWNLWKDVTACQIDRSMEFVPGCRFPTLKELQSVPFFDALSRAHFLGSLIPHRKSWEIAYILLSVESVFGRRTPSHSSKPGPRGLGFAVGQEPLPGYFASAGYSLTCSDLPPTEAVAWANTAQNAASMDELWTHVKRFGHSKEMTREEFDQRVKFQFADMNKWYPEWHDSFDFVWSTCSVEHVGSVQLGLEFIARSLLYLKPGGASIHTVEFSLSDNNPFSTDMLTGGTVVWRRHHIERLFDVLEDLGYRVSERCFFTGDSEADCFVDEQPYGEGVAHLRLRLGRHAATSFGFMIRRPQGLRSVTFDPATVLRADVPHDSTPTRTTGSGGSMMVRVLQLFAVCSCCVVVVLVRQLIKMLAD